MINDIKCKICGGDNAFIFLNDEILCSECFDKYRKEKVLSEKMIMEKIRGSY